MPDILVLTQEAIHDLASGKEVIVPLTGGKLSIMSEMLYRTIKDKEKKNEQD